VSRAAVAESKAAVDAAKANVAALKASVKAAESNVKICERNLGWTTVTAEISGRVDRNMLTEGNMVEAGVTVLTNIVVSDATYAYFNVDERTVQELQKMVREGKLPRSGTVPISLRLQSEKDFAHDGYLDFYGNKLDAGTGTLQVRGIFENPDGALKPGFFVRVRVPVDTPRERLLVPERALGTDQGQKYLLVVNDKDTVEYRKVKLGLADQGMRSVEEGLKADEWFITRGLQRVRPKEVVKPEKMPQKTPQT
jgi:RND family efflux transporter MFP subunit